MAKLVDLTGQRFGKLTVLRRAENRVTPSGQRLTYWRCQCDCGRVKEVKAEHLKQGKIISCKQCGLHSKENSPIYKHGGTHERLYKVWANMKQRCFNPNNKKYGRYGGRGIAICEEWLEYNTFREWAYSNGYDDTAEYGECTLDRIDVNGNYEPSNCRWVDEATQSKNKETNIYLTYKGETKVLKDWARELNTYGQVLKRRLDKGWTAEMTIETPINRPKRELKCELYCDSLQNFKSYQIPRAQLIIADLPYNLESGYAYGSSPLWYEGGDNKNGESALAGKDFFYADGYFRIPEFFNFAVRMLRKEGNKGESPCMIVFCSFQQMPEVIEWGSKEGLKKYIPLFFIKNYSPQVLKANMKVVGATEYALLLYRDKLPKFRNNGQMVFNWFPWERDGKEIPKIHPTQKSVAVLKRLIEIFTDPGDVVIDPCFGSGSTARACMETGRNFYGFEISKEFYRRAKEEMCNPNYINEKDQIEGQMNIMDFIGSAS